MLRNDHFFSIAGHFSRASRRMPIFLRDQMPEERLGVGGRRHRVHAHREEGLGSRLQASIHLPLVLHIPDGGNVLPDVLARRYVFIMFQKKFWGLHLKNTHSQVNFNFKKRKQM